jgi:hypothetical protein
VTNTTRFEFSVATIPAGTASPTVLTASPLYTTDIGCAVVVPAALPRDTPLTVAVAGNSGDSGTGTGTGIAGYALNSPELTWMQGSGGDATVPGGWIRVFGRSLAFVPLGTIGLPAPPSGRFTTLQLTPTTPTTAAVRGVTRILPVLWENVSAFQAHFLVPIDLSPGEYTVARSHG